MYASAVLGQPADASALTGNFAGNAAPNPPSAVSLNHPTGVAIGTGRSDLFVADTGNHRVLWSIPATPTMPLPTMSSGSRISQATAQTTAG